MRHDGDCNIYRADYPYCDCGLMRKLMRDPIAATDLYEHYERDLEREWGWQRALKYPMPEPVPKTAEEIAEAERMLEKVFGQRQGVG